MKNQILVVTAMLAFALNGFAATITPAPPSAKADARYEVLLPTDKILRRRVVSIDFESLRAGIKNRQITLELFPDTTILARTDEESVERNILNWRGSVPDAKLFGRALLTTAGKALVGTIQYDNRMFAIRPAGADFHEVIEIDTRAFPKESSPRTRGNGRQSAQQSPTIKAAASAGTGRLKILVVLSRPYRYICEISNLGIVDLKELLARTIENNLEEIWGSMAETDIGANATIYCSSRTPSGGDLNADLDWLRTNSTIRSTRNSRNADLVTYYVPSGSYCGRGYYNAPPVVFSDEQWAFSVVRGDCALGNLSLAHELGHNLGMNHDRYVEGGGDPAMCNYGFTITLDGNPVGTTVMAYPDYCDSKGRTCGRWSTYSHPGTSTILGMTFRHGVSCGAGTTGVNGSANNTFQLRTAAPVAKTFR